MKLVSVIIPVHNGEKFINRCVISALNQDYPNVEVIVVDDGSTDKTLSILKNFKDEKLTVLNQKKAVFHLLEILDSKPCMVIL